MASTHESSAGQPSNLVKTYHLVLSKAIKGTPVLPNAAATFTLNWNFATNEGQANLNSLDGTQTNIVLNPEGLAGELAFMSGSTIPPYHIKGKEVIMSQVFLITDSQGNNPRAAIVFNKNRSVVEATASWSDNDKSYDQKPSHHS